MAAFYECQFFSFLQARTAAALGTRMISCLSNKLNVNEVKIIRIMSSINFILPLSSPLCACLWPSIS